MNIVILEQKTVTFYDDELLAVRATDGHIYVSIRQLCRSLGLDRKAQVRRIMRHTVLAEGLKGGAILAPPSTNGRETSPRRGGGVQQTQLLRVDLVPLWLSGIRTKMVADDIRPQLERFQREAAKVLWEAFQDGKLTEDFDALLATADPDTIEAYQIAESILKLARSQILLQAELRNHTHRIEAIEAQLGNSYRFVTEDQAMQISQAVKLIARELAVQTKRNEHGAVYGELYRTFGITSYKRLPAGEFDKAMDYLRHWYLDMTQSPETDLPF